MQNPFMELLFAYGAGLLTLINPCVLPVLPIVLVSSLNVDRRGPIALAGGMSLSFVVFGVLVTAFGSAIGLTQERLADIGAVMMILFGAVLLIPALSHRFETATAGFANRADSQMNTMDGTGLKGQFIGGVLLGIVWSPCIGPTLGGAIALASQGENLLWVTLIMTSFALGVSTLILGLGLGTQSAIRGRAKSLQSLAMRSKPIIGVVFVGVGAMLLFKFHYVIEGWLVRIMPYWLQDFSVIL
jgi:cytochrome c biogenesis protein CcdA